MVTLADWGARLTEKFDSIRSLGIELYGSFQKWARISEQLELLKRRILLLESESTWIDQQSAESMRLIGLISKASTSLRTKEEELQMEKSWPGNSCCTRTLFRSSKRLTELHEFVGSNVQRMFDALDNFSPEVFDFSYVNLSVPESAIADAINGSRFSTIILAGPPGSGKSTVARYIAWLYLEDARRRSLQFAETLTRSGSAGHTPLFSRVLFLKCGPNVDAVSRHTEFLHLCGRNRSENLDTLLVLDDVRNNTFLQEFLDICSRSHTRIKYLVTSCNNHLRTENSVSIEIQVVPAQAMAILASHIGFPDHHIPDPLQDIADRVIKSLNASPFALAKFAREIRNKRLTDPAAWQEAEMKLLSDLREEREMKLLSDFSAIKLSFMSLSEAAQNLLLLISVCKDSSISEDVLQVMYESSKLKWETRNFSQVRSEVETWNWVMLSSGLCEWNDALSGTTRRTFSLSSFHAQTVRKGMEEKIDLLMCNVFGEDLDDGPVAKETNNEDVFITILGAIFFEKSLYSSNIRAARASKLGVNMQNLRVETRSAIEPLLWLVPNIQRNEGHGYEWDETTSFAARKVILSYVRRNLVEDSHIKDLLLMPSSRRATCWALGLMLRSRDTPIIHEKPTHAVKALVDFLGEKVSHIQLTEDVIELDKLACNHKKFPFILRFLGFLKKLESINQADPSTYLEAKTVMILMVTKIISWLLVEHENGMILSTVPENILGAIDVVTHSGFLRGDPIIQDLEAARHLVDISRDQNERKLFQIRDVAGYVMHLLYTDSDQSVAMVMEVLRALNSQSVLGEVLREVSLQEHVKVVDRLLQLLDGDDLPEAQLLSAELIAHLAEDKNNREIIIENINASTVLMKALHSPDLALREEVWWALKSLCPVNIADIAGMMQLLYTDSGKSLDVVVKVLRSVNSQPGLKEVLRKVSLQEHLKVVDRLLQLLDEDDLPEAQLLSANLIVHLAEDKNNREIIIENINASTMLMKTLHSPDLLLQEEIRCVLKSLRQAIVADVAGMMQLLYTDSGQGLDMVLKVLRSLNSQPGLKEVLRKVSLQEHLKVVDRLLQLLDRDDLPEAQLLSANLIAHLAEDKNNRKIITENSYATTVLMKAIQSPDLALREKVWWALESLCPEEVLWKGITKFNYGWHNMLRQRR